MSLGMLRLLPNPIYYQVELSISPGTLQGGLGWFAGNRSR